MVLKELNYIVTLAEERSISAAAERLYMAQSSLSEFLQQQEAELGVKLFVRSSRGLRPTKAGELYIENAKRMLQLYREVEIQLHDISNLQGGEVILGISSFRGRYMVPKLLKAFREEYPNIHVKIVEKNSMALEKMLVEGKVDLAFVVLPLKHLQHSADFVMQDEIFLVANRSHPVMQYAKPIPGTNHYWVDLKDTKDFEYILGDTDSILGNFARKTFEREGINPPSYNNAMTADLAAVMARSGLGLAFTYHSCAVHSEDVVYLSIGEQGEYIDIALAHPLGRYQSRAARALTRVAHEILG